MRMSKCSPSQRLRSALWRLQDAIHCPVQRSSPDNAFVRPCTFEDESWDILPAMLPTIWDTLAIRDIGNISNMYSVIPGPNASPAVKFVKSHSLHVTRVEDRIVVGVRLLQTFSFQYSSIPLWCGQVWCPAQPVDNAVAY